MNVRAGLPVEAPAKKEKWMYPLLLLLAAGCASQELTQSAVLMAALDKEIASGIERREVEEIWQTYQNWSDGRLDASEGNKTWSDKTGNCRLGWYDRLMRDQLRTPTEAERLSNELHQALLRDHRGLRDALAVMATHIDLRPSRNKGFRNVNSKETAIQVVRTALRRARKSHQRAFSRFSTEEAVTFRKTAYPNTMLKVEGHTLPDKETGRATCDLMEKIDRRHLYAAADALIPLTDIQLLRQLKMLKPTSIATANGQILVGSPADDTYALEELSHVSVLIDLGGNDSYLEGTASIDRPVLIVIDLAGDDHYQGKNPGIQGSAIGGVSLLLDLAGDDRYEADDVAQASVLGGVGILIDFAGNDTYRGHRRVQGSAFCGLALLIDRAGHDEYHAAMLAQGVGAPLGFGLLEDLSGDDHYYAGGLYVDGYDDTPGYEAWSQGVGAGPRGVANGGVGVMLDGAGDDKYEFDYFSHGGGYWFAVGIARDFAGNDHRGPTQLAFDGNQRDEKIFLRWGMGWQAHYGLGFVFDDAGDDIYSGDIVGLGFSWDIGVAGLFDFAGNDRYEIEGVSQGQARQAGLGILYDVDGDDVYLGDQQGHADPTISYHPQPDSGGNFSFVVDYGGTDHYGSNSDLNNGYHLRGSDSGFLIDRSEVPGIGTR